MTFQIFKQFAAIVVFVFVGVVNMWPSYNA